MKKRIFAVILCIVMTFTATVLPAGAAGLMDSVKKLGTVYETGYTMPDLGNILRGVHNINMAINRLTGLSLFTDERLAVTVDNTIQGVIDSIAAVKGVDFTNVYNFLPPVNRAAELIDDGLRLDVPETRRQIKAFADELEASGQLAAATGLRLTAVWLGLVDELDFVLDEVDGKPGVYKFAAVLTFRDGSQEKYSADIFYDSNRNMLVGADDTPALLGFYMDLDQMYTYTGVNCWQRNFGFCFEYDLFCYLTPYIMNYTTQRIKFVYDNLEWMCQVWKGRYFIANGGELGFYNRPIGSKGTFYNCISDDYLMDMSLSIYHGDELIFARPTTKHWWVTGFAVGETAYLPRSLTLVGSVTLLDEDMLSAFTKALDKKWYCIDYTVDGLTVTMTW